MHLRCPCLWECFCVGSLQRQAWLTFLPLWDFHWAFWVAAGIADGVKLPAYEKASLCLQGRLDKKMTQAQLAQAINEKPQIIQVCNQCHVLVSVSQARLQAVLQCGSE